MQEYLNGYRYIKDLGSGGFGEVILAEEMISGRHCAIKSLHRTYLVDSEVIQKEIKIISQFYHSNIVTYHTAFEKDDQFHFVMEYCKHGSLADRLLSGCIPQKEAISIILDVAKALAFIHSKGIVHHDIKPSNLLVSDEHKVKIADFGVANSTGGTRVYMPPIGHMHSNFEYDVTIDIYSLGITFIELLTGKHPLVSLSMEEAIKKLENKDLGISQFSDWLKGIIYKMVSLNPEFRFKKVEDFIEALETKNIPITVDEKSLLAAKMAKRLSLLLSRKKYYTIKKTIEQIDPALHNYPVLLQQLGRYYFQSNDLDKAQDVFNALRLKLPSASIHKELGAIELEQGNYAKAISLLSEHLQVYSDDCEAYNILLESYFRSGRFEEGRTLCDGLIRSFPRENCFKQNGFLFDLLNYYQKGLPMSEHVNNGKMLNYNIGIFNFGKAIINESKGKLTDKLVFVHYNLTKAKGFNRNFHILINGSEPVVEYDYIITIGRKGYKNTVEFEGTYVSRKHCIIIPLENENWIYDLNSTGTYVDGVRIKNRKRLTHKHEIEVGGHQFVVNVDKTKLF